MAEIVIGIASSHTPQLSSGVDMWPDHALRDQRYQLLGKDAEYHTYAETLAGADPELARELEPEVWEGKYQRAQAAISSLTATLAAANADLALVIGDDQHEMFLDDGVPAFAIFTGTELLDIAPDEETFAKLPKGIQAAFWAVHGEQKAIHPVAQELSAHIAERLTLADYDLTVFTRQPAGRSLGHAFTFPRYRLGLPATTPIVPVFVNTYYPPNVPSAARCYALGRELRQAVESWDSDARVAVIASGGLTHFVIDEDLDRAVLDAIAAKDAAALAGIPRGKLRSGNSEILNWVTAAAALEGLSATILDYVPGYRTPAGTGTGMAFTYWD
jgi:3-O-methylgallate 3,4-dioxygenase